MANTERLCCDRNGPSDPEPRPQLEQDAHDPGVIRLSGTWTLKTALAAAEVLRGVLTR